MDATCQEIARLESGAHICLPYVSQEDREKAIAAFLIEGLRRGERCAFVGLSESRDGLVKRLHSTGIAVEDLRNQGALALYDVEELTPRDAPFDPDSRTKVIQSLIADARTEGYAAFRGVGDYPATRQGARDAKLILKYETDVGDLLRTTGSRAMCAYDRRHTDADTMTTVLRAHPLALLRGTLCENPFCEPGAYLEGRVGEPQRLDWMINQILTQEQTRRYEQEISNALLREAVALATSASGLRGEIASLKRAVEARDLLFGTIARRLQRPVERLSRRLDAAPTGETAPRPGAELGDHDLEDLRELAAQIEEIAVLIAAEEPRRSESSDLTALCHAAAEQFHSLPGRRAVPLRVSAPPQLMGPWDGPRLQRVIEALLNAAYNHSWGTPLDLRIESLGESARLTLRFHALDVDPKAGSPGLGLGHAIPSRAYDRLGVELWAPRELVRMMAGTFGVSGFADAQIALTVELPLHRTDAICAPH